MFTPENDLERSFIRAANEPGHRPNFLRELMDARIFIAVELSGALPAVGADKEMVLPQDMTARLRSWSQNGRSFLPFFTAPSRAHEIMKKDHAVAPEKTHELFQRYPDAQFVLNPGSEYSKEFLREEVARLLAGDFGDAVERFGIEGGTRMLLGQPAQYPSDLVAALSALFEHEPAITAAHLVQAAYGEGPPHLVIGLAAAENFDLLMQRLGPKMHAALPAEQLIDFVPTTAQPFEDYFRAATPFFKRR